MDKKGITRNQNQAVFKYLPNCWSNYKDKNDYRLGDRSYTVKVRSWNTVPVSGIFTQKIYYDIRRNIGIFRSRSGDVSSFRDYQNYGAFSFVKAAQNEDNSDINVDVDPLLFYCSKCGSVKQARNPYENFSNFRCNKCEKSPRLNQLQLLYSCECGHAQGVFLPDSKHEYFYFPNNSSFQFNSTFKFIYYEDRNRKLKEMVLKCPSCGKTIFPKNAIDRVHFKNHSIRTVNLISADEGEFFSYELDAKKVMISRWFGLINEEQFKSILHNQKSFFDSRIDNDESVQSAAQEIVNLSGGSISIDVARSIILSQRRVGSGVELSLMSIVSKLDEVLGLGSIEKYDIVASSITEYETLLNPKRRITLSETKKKSLLAETIVYEDEIDEVNKRFGIELSQLSYDIEIINSTYGYTRRAIDPKASQKSLKLIPFVDNNGMYQVYNTSLETEGILFQFDRMRIIEWLISNEILERSNAPRNNELSLKKWFVENMDASKISNFSEIDKNEANIYATSSVYTLLHTISHALIKSIGELSGLDKDSISEMIFVNIPAIFVYANTSQGLPLGALAGLFEQDYKKLVEKAFYDTQSCVFDPICEERDHSACSSCIFLSDVSCTHFNNDLSRVYLHGNDQMKGFWSE